MGEELTDRSSKYDESMAEERKMRLMDSLIARMPMFSYEPEDGSAFCDWFDRNGETITEDGSSLEDGAKRRLLLSRLNQNDYSYFTSRILPKKLEKSRTLTVESDLCIKSYSSLQKPENQKTTNTTSKYKESNWKLYTQYDVEVCNGSKDDKIHPIMKFNDGIELYSSQEVFLRTIRQFNKIKEKPSITDNTFNELISQSNLFLLDFEDVKRVIKGYETLFEADQNTLLQDITTLSKYIQKKFYIHTVTSSATEMEKSRRVFAEDILEILSIILKQQGDENCERLHEYEEKWIRDDGYLTLNLSEFQSVLEELDIDKSRIILIPDLYHILSTKNTMISSGDPVITVDTSHNQEVIHPSQAIFHMFQSIVCDIDWRMESCKKHPNCKDHFKAIILSQMKKYYLMEDRLYIPFKHVKDRINALKKCCNYISRRHHVAPPIVKLFDCDFKDSISLSFFLSECESFGLTNFRRPTNVTDKQLEESIMPVWKARILFMLQWNIKFFGVANQDLLDIVLNAMLFRAPFPEFKRQFDFADLILSLDPTKQQTAEKLCMQNGESTDEIKKHEWITTNRADRKYIITGQFKRWNESSSVEILREIVHPQHKFSVSSANSISENEETPRTNEVIEATKETDSSQKGSCSTGSVNKLEDALAVHEVGETSKPTTSSQKQSESDEESYMSWDDATSKSTNVSCQDENDSESNQVELITTIPENQSINSVEVTETSRTTLALQEDSSSNESIRADSESTQDELTPKTTSSQAFDYEKETSKLDESLSFERLDDTLKPTTSCQNEFKPFHEKKKRVTFWDEEEVISMSNASQETLKSSDKGFRIDETGQSVVKKLKKMLPGNEEYTIYVQSKLERTFVQQKQKQEIDDLKEKVREIRHELKSGQETVLIIEQMFLELEADLTEARDELEEKQQEIDDLKKKVDNQTKIVSENKEMRQKITRFTVMEAQWKEKNDRLEKELSETRKRMKKETERRQKEINNLKKELTTNSEILNEKISQLDLDSQEIQSKTQKMETVENELKEKKTEIEDLKKRIVFQCHIITENNEQISHYKDMEAQLNDTNSRQQKESMESDEHKENENLRKENGKLKQDISMILEREEQQKTAYNKAQAYSFRRISDLNEELRLEKGKTAGVNGLQDWSDEKLQLEEELEQKKKENAYLHEANIKLDADNEAKRKMIQQLLDQWTNVSQTSSMITPPSICFNEIAHSPHVFIPAPSNNQMQAGYASTSYNMNSDFASFARPDNHEQ